MDFDFYKLFIQPYKSYEPYQIILELAAGIFGILSIFFSIRKNIWVYPTGIISTTIYVYILFVFGLLGDGLINVYLAVMSVYGWIIWSKNTTDHVHIQPSWTKKKEWQYATILFVISFILVTVIYYYKPYMDNHFLMKGANLGLYHLDWANWLDITVTSLLVVGMWLMAKRRIENWIFLMIADVISIPMYIYKGLGITSAQYLVFTVMAVIGYLQWKKVIIKIKI